mmetsp:Transcript_60853/g.175300  ORF Transcript_60853/g.175300 Transcript_60853/m.175300 type:complete len:247 (+) Transcript_60853:832-1572(+)
MVGGRVGGDAARPRRGHRPPGGRHPGVAGPVAASAGGSPERRGPRKGRMGDRGAPAGAQRGEGRSGAAGRAGGDEARPRRIRRPHRGRHRRGAGPVAPSGPERRRGPREGGAHGRGDCGAQAGARRGEGRRGATGVVERRDRCCEAQPRRSHRRDRGRCRANAGRGAPGAEGGRRRRRGNNRGAPARARQGEGRHGAAGKVGRRVREDAAQPRRGHHRPRGRHRGGAGRGAPGAGGGRSARRAWRC